MAVLVTGAAGFVGSHLCERLLAEGHRVWALDNFDGLYDPSLKRDNLSEALRQPAMHLVEGDVRDEILLDGLMSDVAFDAVVHLAARPGVAASLENPELAMDVNVMGTLRLLEAMRRHEVKVLLFGSSASVYGENGGAPQVESDAADRPLSPYAASKRSGELLCHTHHRLYDLTAYCLRLFTVYGPRQRPDLAMHRIARSMADGEAVSLPGDGSSTRDYTYIDDAVDGILLALHGAWKRNGSGPAYEIVNLGRGRPVAVRDMVTLLAEAMDLRPDVEEGPARPGTGSATRASGKRGEELLGYRPQVELEDGVARFAEWFLRRRAASAAARRDAMGAGDLP